MEWLINRRRMMFNKSTPPNYLTFEDPEIWRICCENWGDYNETVITDNGDDTVDIVTTFKSKLNNTIKKSEIISTQTGVDNSGGTYVAGTTKEAVGITKKQCAAVTSLQKKFNNNKSIGKFHEFKYFTSVTLFSSGGDLSASSLTEITFPSSITEIYGGYAFNACKSLVEINMNEGLRLMNGNYTFNDCTALTTLTIPSTVTSITASALYINNKYTHHLTLIVLPVVPPTLNTTFKTGTINSIYVPDDSIELYKEANYWSAAADYIKPMSEYINT